MWKRIFNMLAWRKERHESAAAMQRAETAILDATHRQGKADATLESVRHRVFSVNHISEDIEAILRSRGDDRS